jgi:hypothetical protein
LIRRRQAARRAGARPLGKLEAGSRPDRVFYAGVSCRVSQSRCPGPRTWVPGEHGPPLEGGPAMNRKLSRAKTRGFFAGIAPVSGRHGGLRLGPLLGARARRAGARGRVDASGPTSSLTSSAARTMQSTPRRSARPCPAPTCGSRRSRAPISRPVLMSAWSRWRSPQAGENRLGDHDHRRAVLRAGVRQSISQAHQEASSFEEFGTLD